MEKMPRRWFWTLPDNLVNGLDFFSFPFMFSPHCIPLCSQYPPLLSSAWTSDASISILCIVASHSLPGTRSVTHYLEVLLLNSWEWFKATAINFCFQDTLDGCDLNAWHMPMNMGFSIWISGFLSGLQHKWGRLHGIVDFQCTHYNLVPWFLEFLRVSVNIQNAHSPSNSIFKTLSLEMLPHVPKDIHVGILIATFLIIINIINKCLLTRDWVHFCNYLTTYLHSWFFFFFLEMPVGLSWRDSKRGPLCFIP